MPKFAILIAFLLAATAVQAETIRVPSEQPTIQAGIDAASDTDTVLVAPGIFVENLDFSGKAIKLLSEAGKSATIIEPADPAAPILSFVSSEDTTSVLAGFTIRNTNGAPGIYIDSASPIIEHCDINNCNVSEGIGGGIRCRYSSAIIRYNEIHHNSTQAGAGVGTRYWGLRPLEIAHNRFHHNHADYSGSAVGCIAASNTVIHHNSVYSNTGCSEFAGVIEYSGNCGKISNNTVCGNSRGIHPVGHDLQVFNNIVASNEGEGLFIGQWGNPQYNNVWNNGSYNDPGTDGMSVDPIFVDAENGDFSLDPTSPCIDAGHPDPSYFDADGTRSDIGAIPHQSTPAPYADNLRLTPEGPNATILSLEPEIRWDFVASGPALQQAYEIEIGTDDEWSVAEILATGPINSGSNLIQYDGPVLSDRTKYCIRVRVEDGSTWGGWRQRFFTTHVDPVVAVPADVPSIQGAIDQSVDGDSILVGPGTYVENLDLSGKLIWIGSTDGPGETTIQPADPSIPTVLITHDEPFGTEIVGFRFLGGTADYVVHLTNSSSCYLYQNEFVGYAGGHHVIGCQGGICVVERNIFQGNDGYCVALELNNAYGAVLNNTMVGNAHGVRSNSYGSLVFNNIIYDCLGNTLWNNAKQHGYNVYWNPDREVIFDQADPEPTDIIRDPLVVAPESYDFHISAGSPCIDAGNPASEFYDPNGSINDIGALPYEYANYPVPVLINYGRDPWNHVVDDVQPTIFWSYFNEAPYGQTEVEIRVGTDQEWSTAEMWESGTIMTADSSILYSGLPLVPYNTYFLRVRVGDGTHLGDWRESWMTVYSTQIRAVPLNYDDIGSALAAAVDDDTVLLAPGTYSGTGNRGLSVDELSVAIISEQGAEVTTVELEGGSFVQLPESDDPYSYDGGSLTLRGISFVGGSTVIALNEWNWGGHSVDCCRFIGNTVGVEVYYPGSMSLDSCYFEQNQVGIFVELSEFASITRSVFLNNGSALQFRIALNFSVANNVLAHNQYAVDADLSSFLHFYRNVVYANTFGIKNLELGWISWGMCNDVYGNDINYVGRPDQTGVSGNVSVDPLFCDPALQTGIGVQQVSPLLPPYNECGDYIGNVFQGCTCCAGRVGDVNGDGGDEPTIADVSALIDFLFISGEQPGCVQEADVNLTGGTGATWADVTIGDISTLIDYLFITGPSLGLAECL